MVCIRYPFMALLFICLFHYSLNKLRLFHVQFGEEGYYPSGYYESQQAQQLAKIRTAINKLENGLYYYIKLHNFCAISV